MPETNGNGRVTLAVLGEKVDTLTEVVKEMRGEMRDIGRVDKRVAVLEVWVGQNTESIGTNAKAIENNQTMRRESRVWDGILTAAAIYAAIQGFGP